MRGSVFDSPVGLVSRYIYRGNNNHIIFNEDNNTYNVFFYVQGAKPIEGVFDITKINALLHLMEVAKMHHDDGLVPDYIDPAGRIVVGGAIVGPIRKQDDLNVTATSDGSPVL